MTHESDGLPQGLPSEPVGSSFPDEDSASQVAHGNQTFDDGRTGEVVRDPPEDARDYSPLPYPIVAIGASAGGVEAYLQLFESLPGDTGMTFVLLPHLSREHESHLVEILSRHTPMPVSEVEHGMQPKANHLYVLPRNQWARMERGKFLLEPRPAGHVPHPINLFFQSLAADQKSRAIGIILSGTDGDGAIGLAEIKGEGGISIVQSPDTAQFPDMPRASIAADHVDLVLPPSHMGPELARLSRQLAKPALGLVDPGSAPDDEGDFQRILVLLRGVSGIHFRQYKPSTLRRRIWRRMLLERIETFSEYARFLKSNPRELKDLQEDLLINVTRFFRDPEVFEVLKQEILPHLFETREPDQQIRIWVAGCSTGQEVYSIAICLLEFLSNRSLEAPIQIFGTDASEQSIAKARLGIYPEALAAEISADRLRRFFARFDKGYQVNKRVRDLCIFARQNLCVDPPFSRLDLVACRNVLIYLGTELQSQVVPTFHYSLRPRGFLLLGSSESIRGYAHLFQETDRKHKFFLRLETPSRLYLQTVVRPSQSDLPKGQLVSAAETWTDLELQRAADKIITARYGPPGVVINERSEIIQLRGHTRPFLEMSQGTANLQLLRMVPDSMVGPLREAVARTVQLGVPSRVDRVTVGDAQRSVQVSIEVLPIPSNAGRPPCFLVLFVADTAGHESSPSPDRRALPQSAEEREVQFLKLREDLESNRLYLHALLEDRESNNQELVSANEEVQSANEELQSTNEELETTKEELQSANEELQTINEELRQRNLVLAQTTSDLSNLLNSVNLPVLMLGSDLQIRHFTPPTQRLINLRPSDVGRPLADIRMNFSVENLDKIFAEVLDTLTPRELEIQDGEGRWHLLRVRPYRTTDNKIDGLVVVLVDVDQFRRSQQELRDARDFARSVIENVPLPLAVLNLDLRIRTVNAAFRKLSGAPHEVFGGRSFLDLAGSQWGMRDIRPHLETLRDQENGPGGFYFEHEAPGASKRTLRVTGCLLQPDHEKVLLVTVEDITAGIEAERVLVVEREQLAGEVHSAHQQLGRTREELRALAGRLMQSQEDERRRVARELHDDVSQKLALLANEGQLLEQQLEIDNDGAKDKLRKLNAHMGELSELVRGISHRLHPSAIEDLGLPAALKNAVEEFGLRQDMPVTFSRRGIRGKVSLDVATNLYRIAQEALRNVSKYAGKTHLKVSLTGTEEEIQLEISDFGYGFDVQALRPGLGLVSMEERARLIGGSFSVESSAGRGTRITVRVPIAMEIEAE